MEHINDSNFWNAGLFNCFSRPSAFSNHNTQQEVVMNVKVE